MLGNDWRTGALAKIRFDPPTGPIYAVGVEKGNVSAFGPPQASLRLRLPLPHSLMAYVGRGLFRFLLTMQGLGAFEAGFGAHTGSSPKPAVCPLGPDFESLWADQAEEHPPAPGRERDR